MNEELSLRNLLVEMCQQRELKETEMKTKQSTEVFREVIDKRLRQMVAMRRRIITPRNYQQNFLATLY